jgi:organic hydroperoxide reductase OsmC/OhrA
MPDEGSGPRDQHDGEPHRYSARVAWSGSTADGYAAYDRRHAAEVPAGGQVLPLSSAPAFGGDPALPDPEQLLVLAAASCQLLSFLAVAARARLVVLHYVDDALGEMPDRREPTGLTRIDLRPQITLADHLTTGAGPVSLERVLHLCEVAHRECYIANSVRTEIRVEPEVTFADPT